MQRFNKTFRMRRSSRTKSFNRMRPQNRRPQVREFKSRKSFIRGVFTCLCKEARRIAHNGVPKSTPLKNILIYARAATTLLKVRKRAPELVTTLPKTPQEIMFNKFFRRLTVVKIRKAVKTPTRAKYSQLYIALCQNLSTAKRVFTKETPVVKVQASSKDPINPIAQNQWKKMSRQDKYNFYNKSGKFKKNIEVISPAAKGLTTTLLDIIGARAPTLIPQNAQKQKFQQNVFDLKNTVGKVATKTSNAAQSTVMRKHSKNWIPEDQWKKMPKRARDEFLASTGKLKQK